MAAFFFINSPNNDKNFKNKNFLFINRAHARAQRGRIYFLTNRKISLKMILKDGMVIKTLLINQDG